MITFPNKAKQFFLDLDDDWTDKSLRGAKRKPMECRKIWRNMVCTSFTIQPTVKMSRGSPKQDTASTNCLCMWQLQYIFNFVYSETVKRTWWKPKNISIFGRSSCYVGLFGAAIFLGIFGGGIFSTVGYFWRRDIFGAPGHPRQGMACLCCVPRSGPIEGRLSFAGGFRVRWIFAKLTYLPSNLLTIHSQPWGVVILAQWG